MVASPSAGAPIDGDRPDPFEFDDEDVQSAVVPPEHAGQRLDQSLARLFPDYSRSRLQAWLAAGRIIVDGARAEPARKVRGGEVLMLAAAPDPREVSFVADQANFTPEKIETRSDRMGQVYRAKVRILNGVEKLQPGTEGNVYVLDGAPA